ncbi:MAG: sigma-70 family RNA polymerase sigma factor [Planctomycetes bacterium]|nr:sigma-70 family RNA polymerase sigma factor [Planctomycetota bacterium]MBL7044668.1 sigma-70 family RNA polymerase sigma factor [Pirellulaceae bacterium]
MEENVRPTDLDLLRRAREGRWEAFEELVSRFEPRVFGLTRRILNQRQDAEDATQQTFLSVMEHMDRFREEASVATWILRIATNHALKTLRKQRGLKTVPLETQTDSSSDEEGLRRPDFIAEWHNDPADLAEQSEVMHLLREALEELDEKYRVVFVLRDIEEFSTQETAELLDISVSNVKVRLLRARLQLRERLTRALGDESTQMTAPADHNH